MDGARGDDVLNGGGGDDELTGGRGNDNFVFGPNSGNDRIVDFQDADEIVFNGVAGVDDFSDLVITRMGRDVHITWGDGTHSIILEGTRFASIDASDFSFI